MGSECGDERCPRCGELRRYCVKAEGVSCTQIIAEMREKGYIRGFWGDWEKAKEMASFPEDEEVEEETEETE